VSEPGLPWLLVALLALGGCRSHEPLRDEDAPPTPRAAQTESQAAGSHEEPAVVPARGPVTVLLGGDIDFGRLRGERLVREPGRNDFAPLERLFGQSDVRFANLESTVSDLFDADRRAPRPLVFTAPLAAAEALARGRLDVVSLANNHAWDYGEEALTQTLDALARTSVGAVGAGRTRAASRAPYLVAAKGLTLGFVAVTSAWNQSFDPHPGKDRIADDDPDELAASIAEARRRGADRVIVSHHGGEEYVAEPSVRQRELARFAVDRGADVVVGHHAHVVQRTARIDGKPVLYGLGNLLMRMVTPHPETELGALARLTFREKDTLVELCPVRASGLDVVVMAEAGQPSSDAARFRGMLERLERAATRAPGERATRLGEFDESGCAPLLER